MATDAPTIEMQVLRILEEILRGKVENPVISTTAPLTEVGMASIDMVNFLLQIEEEFAVQIPTRLVTPANFSSVDAVVKVISRLMAPSAA
jgi:acyl carrier protein